MPTPLLFTAIKQSGSELYQRGVMDYLPVSANTELATIRPYLEAAQDETLGSVLGAELTSLSADYDADASALSAEQLAILPDCQAAIANLGYMRYLAIGNVHVGDMGITVTNTTTQAPASQWRIKDLRNRLELDGWNAVQRILVRLWANADDYTDWKGDEAAKTEWRPFLLNTATELSKWWDIGGGFDLFVKLRPSIRRVQTLHLRQTLGEVFLAELLTAWYGLSPTAAQTTLIEEYLQPAIANLAIADGITKVSAQLDARGLLETSIGTGGGNTELRSKPDQGIYGSLRNNAYADGIAYLERAVDYLNANASTFPTWESSNLYEDPDDATTPDINLKTDDEDNDRAVFVSY